MSGYKRCTKLVRKLSMLTWFLLNALKPSNNKQPHVEPGLAPWKDAKIYGVKMRKGHPVGSND